MDQEQRHIHKFTDTVVPPTCQERGYTLHSCDCGYSHKDQFTPLGSHQYEIAEATVATCTDGGSRRERCAVCGEEKVTNVPALGHDWENWSVQVFPTCTEGGTEVRRCKRCGNTESRDVAPKGHAPVKSKNEKGETVHFCKNCGEIVYVPTAGDKVKALWKKCKKPLIGLAVAAAAFFVTFQFGIPQFHYTVGKLQLKNDNYEKAFKHFMACWDYRDTETILQDFTLVTREDRQLVMKNSQGEDKTTGTYDWVYSYGEEGKLEHGSATYKEYDDAGNLVREWGYAINGDKRLVCEYEYNESGVLVSYFIAGAVSEEKQYDEYGNVVTYVKYKEGGTVDYRHTYENTYDENGKLLSVICYRTTYGIYAISGKLWEERYTYYENGNMRTQVQFNGSGYVVEESKYYKNGNLKETVYCNSDSAEWEKEDVWKKEVYYRNGNLKNVEYYDDGSVTDKYTYYRNGNDKYGMRKDSDGKLVQKSRGKRNGARVIKFYEDGKLKTVAKINRDGVTTYEKTIYEDSIRVETEKKRWDSYGRLTKWIIKSKAYGTEFPDRFLAERTKAKSTYQYTYTDLEVRYMPDYGAENNK